MAKVKVRTDPLVLVNEDDVRRVVDYLYKSEQKDYEEWERPKDHIFLTLQRLRRAIK